MNWSLWGNTQLYDGIWNKWRNCMVHVTNLKLVKNLYETQVYSYFPLLLSHASSSEYHESECWSSQCSSQDSSLHIVATSVSSSSKVIVRVTLLLSDIRLLRQTNAILRGRCSRHSNVTVSYSCVWNCSASNNTTWKCSSYITSVLVFWLPAHFSIGLKFNVKDIVELQHVAYWTLLFGVFLTRPLVTPIDLMKSKEFCHVKVTHHGHVKWLHLLYEDKSLVMFLKGPKTYTHKKKSQLIE